MLFRRVLTAELRRPKSSFVSANSVLHFDDMPSPKGLPLIGTTLSFILQGSSAQLHKYIDKRHKELGPIFKERLGPVSCVFLSHPDDIRAVYDQEGKYPVHIKPEPWEVYNQLYGCSRGLFFMDGPEWWHFRRILNGLLLKGNLKWIENACDCGSDRLIKKLQCESDIYYENLKEGLYKWSLDIVVSILLGAETYVKHSEKVEEELKQLAQIVHLVFETTAKLALIPAPLAAKLRIPRWNRFVKSVDNAIEEANSLVTNLLKIVDSTSTGLLPKLINEKVDIKDIRRIIIDLILASGDTTAITFEWILYLISKNKDVQAKLRTNPDLVKNVIRETLRLYPIATFLTRILPEDSILSGYGVPKGTLIAMSMYTSGRDGRYFKDPNNFRPERWDRKDSNYNRDMHKASLPFAMGLRSCIGKKIAEYQCESTLLKIVKNFDVEIGNKKDVDIVMKMVAHPADPLKLKFHKL